MKKTLFTIAMIIMSMSAFSQSYKQDATLNLFNAIANRWLDVSYEYYLNDESSAGITFQTRLADENNNEFNRTYAISPFYRYFVTQDEHNSGLFGEVFVKINGGQERIIEEVEGQDNNITYEKYGNMALGLSLGYKYRSDKGFVATGYGGVGRNLLNSGGPNVVPRLGISIGYAF